MCKKKLHLLNFFAVFLCCTLAAQEFKEVDFERLLRNHPMMQNHDPLTGRFRNTPSEPQSVEKLSSTGQELKERLLELDRQRATLTLSSLKQSAVSRSQEEPIWASLAAIDKETSEIQSSLREIEELLASHGIPGFVTVMDIADQLTAELLAHVAGSPIVINKLPRFYSSPPLLNNLDLRRFFWKNDAQLLENYLAYSHVISLLFSSTDRVIVYQKEGSEAP